MALSRVKYEQIVPGNKNFTVPVPYISKDHIKVSVDGVDVPFSWLNDNTIQLYSAPPLGTLIDVRRETERNVLLVDFQDASTLTEHQLDLAARQAFFLAQEAFDEADSSVLSVQIHRQAAEKAAAEAAGYAAGVNLPSALGHAGEYLRQREDGSGLEYRTPEQTLADLGLKGATGASNIGYLPVGAGAVARTVQDKLREVVSVKDFGAVGDGVTDDSAAEDAAHAAVGYVQAILYPPGEYAGVDNPFNLYGTSTHRKALAGRYQAGLPAAPTNEAAPVIWAQKFSNADRSTVPNNWDQGGGYFSLIKRGGDAYGAALTGYGLYQGGSGDLIGVHGRVRLQQDGGRAYAGWFYTVVDATAPESWHALELNGCNKGADPGYGSKSQLLRLCMADDATSTNRAATAISIGHPTHLGLAGFYTGIHFEAGAIVPDSGVTTDGEIIRADAPRGAGQNIGGVRFVGNEAEPTAVFKYALRTDEATFSHGNAILMGTNQRIRWGAPSGGPYIAAGTNNVAIGNSFLHILNPVSGTVLQANGVKILGERRTGWEAASGTATRTSFNTSTVTTAQLAERVKALIDDLMSHGLIGA